MPGTINGIGTHYYGKTNRSTRQGYCAKCKTSFTLESYDARLWFVVLFIPVIPLGRKRVVDQCPVCSLHLAVNATEYALQTRATEAEARLALNNAEPSALASLAAHASLLEMRQHDAAEAFRQEALEQYPENAELAGGFAEQLDILGDPRAIDLHRRALKLRPDLASARIGVARQDMADNKLDEARALLDFLQLPGAGKQHKLSALEDLTRHFHKAGRHQETLELARVLIRENPDISQRAEFRTLVRKSESATETPDSILPQRQGGLRKLFFGGPEFSRTQRVAAWAGLGLSVSIAALLISNERIRTNRTLYLLNAFAQPAEVRIDDGKPIIVQEMTTVVLSEGRHRVQVTGPIDTNDDVELSAGYFDRFSRSPFWAVNIGGATALYGQSAPPRPPESKSFLGETFVSLPHVDYIFRTPPNLTPTNEDKADRKVWVINDPMQPSAAVERLSKQHPQVALALAESALKSSKNDVAVLALYGKVARTDVTRMDRTLAAGLSHRPVFIEWHELYLRHAVAIRGAQAVAQQYDGFLQAEPRNPALLYLRGRAEPDVNKRRDHYQRAIAANFSMEWAHYALGVDHASRGEWKQAVTELNLASRLEADIMAEQARELLHQANLASGGTTGVGWTGRTGIARGTAYDYDVLRVTGMTERALEQGNSLSRPLPPQKDPIAEHDQVRRLETVQRASYVLGQLDDCVRQARELVARSPSETTEQLLAEAIIASGKGLEDADALLSSRILVGDEAWMAVALVGALAANKNPLATNWRTKAADAFKANGGDDMPVAELLSASTPPSAVEVENTLLFPGRRALLLATLAQLHPAKREDYIVAARKWCIGYLPPNQTTRRLIGEAP